MKKKDLDRLKRLVKSWQKDEQEMQRLHGDEYHGSIRAVQNKDCSALAEAIKFIEEVKHGKSNQASRQANNRIH